MPRPPRTRFALPLLLLAARCTSASPGSDVAATDAVEHSDSLDVAAALDVRDVRDVPVASDTPAPSDAGDAGDTAPPVDGGNLAGPVAVSLTGSLQNPCWSPHSDEILFTRFRTSYNTGLSDLGIVAASGGAGRVVTFAAAQNVNLPGSCWNSVSGRIVYSSDDVDRDEVWLIDASGGSPTRVTNRPGAVAFEPSLSPDGTWIVFESHPEGVDTQGSLWKVRSDGTTLTQLTDGSGDDREPNWSPSGNRIVFQSMRSGNWDIWTIDTDGQHPFDVTASPSEDTDASFSPDGMRIVYSSDFGSLLHSALFVIAATGGSPVRVRPSSTDYEGAPSWSPDGRWIAFETYPGMPDGSPGTTLAIAPAPL